MGREAILAEIEKLTVSQRKAMRRLIKAARPSDRFDVRVYETATTVFVERDERRLFVRLTPRGRAIEAKTWSVL
jgi:hypothetical protein